MDRTYQRASFNDSLEITRALRSHGRARGRLEMYGEVGKILRIYRREGNRRDVNSSFRRLWLRDHRGGCRRNPPSALWHRIIAGYPANRPEALADRRRCWQTLGDQGRPVAQTSDRAESGMHGQVNWVITPASLPLTRSLSNPSSKLDAEGELAAGGLFHGDERAHTRTYFLLSRSSGSHSGWDPVPNVPYRTRPGGALPGQYVDEHQAYNDLHKDHRHEQYRAAGQVLLGTGNGGGKER